ncbi:hypothetical protein BaRGS_00037168 [Batillaria attramentaria]|uniref:Endonuclease/exonuclease/phosphatase domain-containing protein n=1 Tax=Batillaria attramentaria TaxID=370345 RepID=A0ABD0J9E1_9CAEN
MDKSVFGFTRDVCLCAAYIPPQDSPYYKHLNVDSGYSFESMQNALADVVTTAGACSIALCGDMNSRTASVSCLSVSVDENGLEHLVYEKDRHSQDAKLNTSGEKLLELCSMFDLQNLNGLLDAASGRFTYVCHNGASVVDYFLVSDDLLGKSPFMTVGDCHVSKHFPLELPVKVGLPLHWEHGDVNDTTRKECHEKMFWRNDQ